MTAFTHLHRVFVFFLCATLFLFVGFADAASVCTPTSPAEQTCIYKLGWDWEQGDGGPADGFIVQQMVDDNGEWYDIYDPLPIAEKTLTDFILGDKGGRRIDWRVMAVNSAVRSEPSNTAGVVTPVIAAIGGVNVTTRPGLLVNVSRRATDTASIISVLVNKDEIIGPQGVEIAYPAGKTLNVSRRALNTSSIVSFLVNRNEVVTVNGQVK